MGDLAPTTAMGGDGTVSTSDQPACAWLCGPPQGPSTPFATPELAVLDSLRMVCFASAAVALAFTVVMVVRNVCTSGQRVRFIATAGLIVYAALTELEHLGDLANIRLIIGLMSLMALAWGNFSALRLETPTQPHWHHPGAE